MAITVSVDCKIREFLASMGYCIEKRDLNLGRTDYKTMQIWQSVANLLQATAISWASR